MPDLVGSPPGTRGPLCRARTAHQLAALSTRFRQEPETELAVGGRVPGRSCQGATGRAGPHSIRSGGIAGTAPTENCQHRGEVQHRAEEHTSELQSRENLVWLRQLEKNNE